MTFPIPIDPAPRADGWYIDCHDGAAFLIDPNGQTAAILPVQSGDTVRLEVIGSGLGVARLSIGTHPPGEVPPIAPTPQPTETHEKRRQPRPSGGNRA